MVGRRSMPSDADDDSQRLRNYLLQCSSRDMVAACQAVEVQLQSVGGENVRDFYRLCFPILLRKIFGFEDVSVAAQPSSSAAGGWLAQASVAGNEAAARALINLLSPRGALFSSLLAADKENFVRYVFPMERLPEWVRRLLSLDKGAEMLSQVSALFKSRIMEDATGWQVHLDVFEYYMFWFAYYAVCKDPNSSQGAAGGRRSRSTVSRSSQFRMQLESWASSIPRLHHSPQAAGAGGTPYLQLLKLYLSHFVLYGSPSKEYPGRELQLGDGGSASHGDILIHTLVEFWLVDDDPSPLPLALRQSLGLQTGGTSTVLTYIPPGKDLTDSLKVLIKFLNSNLRSSLDDHYMALTPSPVLESSLSFRRKHIENGSGHFSSPISASPTSGTNQFPSPSSAYIQALQRPMYRFLLRAFRLWPIGTSFRKIAQVVDVWLDYLEPWSTGLDAAKAREQGQRYWSKDLDNGGSAEAYQTLKLSPSLSLKKADGNAGSGVLGSKAIDCEVYTELWQGYVLANYLFYTSLVTNFLEFALKFVHIDPEAIFQMVYKVLSVLARSKELLELLRKVDVAFGGHIYGRPHQRNNLLLDLAPTIQEQLQDWEEGPDMNDEQEQMDGSMLRLTPSQVKPANLRLFSNSDNGANRLLQALFMRAEIEIQASSSEKPPLSAHALELVKEVARKIFDLHTLDNSPRSLQSSFGSGPQGILQPENHQNDSLATQRVGLQRHSWQDVKYKGDWMRRPIESTEVAVLARVFVRISDSINTALGLTTPTVAAVRVNEVPTAITEEEQVQMVSDQPQPVEVVLPSSSGQSEIKFSEIVDLVKGMLWQILVILQLEARNRGWRVNLRFMAGKKFLVLSTVAVLLYWAVRAIVSCIASYMG